MESITSRLINWASILDDKTREQALTTSRLPFIYPHLALMPDAHWARAQPWAPSSRRWAPSFRPPSAWTSAAA